ncbi:MAG: biopolymer transporter ExbD [Planctomycetes bacterium]|nr:biopolymer transporter ExbD [Planctomycetota bacterium]
MKVRRKDREAPEIPTAALSDIALLLLIFFIVTTEFLVQQTLPAELPAITPEKEEATEDPITVVVAKDFVYLNEERIELDQLASFLAARLAGKVKREERAVVIDGRTDVPYHRVAKAVNEVTRAGGIPTIMKVEE